MSDVDFGLGIWDFGFIADAVAYARVGSRVSNKSQIPNPKSMSLAFRRVPSF